MADNTKIEWAEATWNPIVGCSKTSEGCAHCYAERMAHRLGSNPTMKGRYAGLTDDKGNWTGEVRLIEEALDKPFSWKKPRRIFVGSMTDLFHKNVPDEWIYFVLAVVALNPRHTFMVLTKRAERMQHFMATNQRDLRERIEDAAMQLYGEEAWASAGNSMMGALAPGFNVGWPMRNLWLGVTAENQARLEERAPLLVTTPAAVRFVSYEPALGPVDLGPWLGVTQFADDAPWSFETGADLDWVICGGETGPGARPMHPNWSRNLRDQCAAAGVPYFFKQWGEWAPLEGSGAGTPTPIRCWQGGEWQNGLTTERTAHMVRVGKAKAGHLLDGREHLEFPEVRA